jgi:5'-nucleotidase
MKDRPLILITNDDGVSARGIKELAAGLKEVGDIVVFAPDGPRSGMSGAITSTIPLSYALLEVAKGMRVYSCTGTPVDCVKLAVNEILGLKPDLLVSGVNQGGNLSVCVHYSGTLGAAAEGCIHDIPSLGVSLAGYTYHSSFGECCRLTRQLAFRLLEEGLPQGVYLNLNVPNLPRVKGVRVCRQAEGRFINEYMRMENPSGSPVYWLTGSLQSNLPPHPEDDIPALDAGYASLVPCKIDVTDYDFMGRLKAWVKPDFKAK